MSAGRVSFDRVWKKFRRGERHDSLRDLVPALARNLLRRTPPELDENEFWVLKDVSFEVGPGEALGIIGQNGAGKSTALKLLTKILRPNKGHCSVEGRVGALIEIAAGFHPDLTGRENVFLQGAIMGMKADEVRRRFDEIVAFSGLEGFIDTPVKRYSSGMNARLGFAIAAHVNPDVLLIDEVLAVGDFTFQQKCYDKLREFRASGTSIVFVSHNMQAVASLCTRGLLLRRGGPPHLGPVGEVVTQYASVAPDSSDNAVEVLESRLTSQGSPIESAIEPGAPVQLDARIRVQRPFPRCGIALRVLRADGLVMFYGASNIGGDVAVDLAPGDDVQVSIGFNPHFLKGTYVLTLQLLDTDRQWQPVTVSGLGSFVVSETTRVEGCAEVYPNYSLTVQESGTGARRDLVGSLR